MARDKKDTGLLASPNAALVGGAVGGVGSHKLLDYLSGYTGDLGDSYGEASKGSAKELYEKLRKGTSARRLALEAGQDAAYYYPGEPLRGIKPHVGLPKRTDPFTVAHELGHATGGKLRQDLMHNKGLLKHVSQKGGWGLLAHAFLTSDAEEGMRASGYAAPAVASIAPLLDLGEEAAATYNAKKLLARKNMAVPHLKKMMALQQANYLLHHASRVAPVAIGAAALHHYLKRKKKQSRKDKG